MTNRRAIARPAPSRRSIRRALLPVSAALAILATGIPAVGVAATVPQDAAPAAPVVSAPAAARPTSNDPTARSHDEPGAIRPTIQYEEAVAHAGDRTAFTAGGRVTVPFTPRRSDRWPVGGVAPRSLPNGRLSGKAIREVVPAPGHATAPAHGRTGDPTPAGPAIGGVDTPNVAPDAAIDAELAAAVDPGGLRREVFGFLPYWELTDTSTRLDWETLSTIAYFGVGAAANGDLQRKDSSGATTVGWSGWTSSKMTGVINAAHANHTRVVLTVQSFAWTSSGVTRQKALLGSSAARANLARQIAAAVRDRGADGVNLDFEPIVSTYADEFTLLVKSVRAELNRYARGYQVTFDTTGWIGNYPIDTATGSTAADAVVVMGYDYKTSSTNRVGSVAPIGGPAYDVRDTVAAYLGRVPASRIILAVPYYGRAWSTDTALLGARNISGTKYGASTTVVYGTAVTYAQDHGKHYDTVEGVAWTVYRRQNCTSTYGCVSPWRQIYYDDTRALGAKYDLVERYGLRGVGIWALGYDGTRPELYQLLKDKFIYDTVPPKVTGSSVSSTLLSPNGDGRLDRVTVNVAVTGLLRWGWLVQPMIDGAAGSPVRSGSTTGKVVSYTWGGNRADGTRAPDGQYRITLWMADASDNRSTVQKIVTIDTRPASITSSATPTTISPNGDGQSDSTYLRMAADTTVGGFARIISSTGTVKRVWKVAPARSGVWSWNGHDWAGTMVPDGRYTYRLDGYDLAGNRTIRDMTVGVDRTVRSLRWSSASFRPSSGGTSRIEFALARAAHVKVAIYLGHTLVRTVAADWSLAAGSYHWTWNGRTAAKVLVAPGHYTAVVTATSWIGTTRVIGGVTVLAP
jgi:spore germination protein YaaH/flagellar hook assembly protein FlgD